jgi:hypothetical protein
MGELAVVNDICHRVSFLEIYWNSQTPTP